MSANNNSELVYVSRKRGFPMCKSTTMVLLLSCTAGSALAQDENEHHHHQGCDGQMHHGMVVPEFRNYLTHAHDDPRDQVEEMGLAW